MVQCGFPIGVFVAMLRGARGIFVAVAGLGLIVMSMGIGAYFGALYSPHTKQYRSVDSDYASVAHYRGPSDSLLDISGIPGFAERAIANPEPTSGEDHEKRDLAAQESMSVWAFWMVGVAALSAIVTTTGTVLLYKQIRLTRNAIEETGKATIAMEKANAIAHRSMVEQLRPWLVANISDGWLFAGGENMQGSAISAVVTIQNVGQTVARQITVLAMSKAAAENFSTEDRIANPHQANQFQKIPDLFRSESSEPFQLTSVGDPKAGYLITITYRTIFDRDEDPLRVTEMFFNVAVGGAYKGGHEMQLAVNYVRAVSDGAGVR